MVVPDDVVRAQCSSSSIRNCVIPDSAFQRRQNLEVVDLCDGLIEIGNDAFIYCYSLRHVNIPSTVKTIGIGSFSFGGASTLYRLSISDRQ